MKHTGPKIGSNPRAPTKKHQRYRSSGVRHVRGNRVRMGGAFEHVEVTGKFDLYSQKITATIIGKRSPANNGKGFCVRETFPSSTEEIANGEATKKLQAILDGYVAKIRSKTYPSRDAFLEDCARGTTLDKVLEDVCPSCICWYCELNSQG